MAIVSVTLDREIVSLIYSLSDRVLTTTAPEGWRSSKLQEHWLYDEVDWLDNHRGPFVHRILLSTGVALEAPFVSVIVHRFALPTAKGATKRTA